MPRLHNADVSSVRRRGPRGGLGSGGSTSGGRRRPGSIGAVGTTPGLLSTDHASTSALASTTIGGKPVVSAGGNPTNSDGDIAAQSTGGQVSGAIGASAMTASGGSNAPLHTASLDDDLMAADLSLGGVRKSLDATFRHSQSPNAMNSPKDNAPATAAGVESSDNPNDGDVLKAKATANASATAPAPEHDDDMEFHASQYDDALTNVEAANGDEPAAHDGAVPSAQTPKDGSSGQDIGSSTTTPATDQDKEAEEAAAINTSTSWPSSRRRRRKVRKSGATASADEDIGSAPVSSADESAEKGKKSGADDDKQVTDALAAVMAKDDGETTNDKEGQEDGNELAKKGSDADTWVFPNDVAAANTSDDGDDDGGGGDDKATRTTAEQQRQQKEPPKKKKSSRPSKSKRRIVGSRVIECEKAPPSSVPPGAVAHSPHPQESAAKKRRKLSVGFDDEEVATTKDITATPANKVKRGQPPMPDSGISLNSVASTPCAAGTPGNESAPDTPADVAHIQGLFDQLNEQVRRQQEEHDAEKKSIHQKWQRKHTKNKERHEAKIRQYQVGYDNLSKEFDSKFAQVNRERAEEKTGFEKKKKMLSERIEKLATELEKKNSKLERWRGRMQEAKQMHAEAWEIDGRYKQLKKSLDAREGRLKSLEEDYESRNTRLRNHKEQLQKRERELARREREMELAIRRKIETEMAEKQSLRSIGQSVAQKLIGFGGGGSGSDTDVAAGDSLHQQRLLLDERELQLDDRERDLDARERAIQGKNIEDGPSSPSKRTPTKNQSAMSRYTYDDSLFDSPASRTRARLSGGSSSSFDSTPSNHDVGGKRKRAPQTPTRTSPRKKKVKVVRSAPPAVQGGGGKKRPVQKATKKKKLFVMDASDSDSSEDF